ncbi:MAG: hypothetical protein QUU85_16210, partial [Candidatus Eisenbacteria bacterium]|nr:hypothetical protein [Candidatus Eisenbacteria bacterium]
LSRGLGDVYKRQTSLRPFELPRNTMPRKTRGSSRQQIWAICRTEGVPKDVRRSEGSATRSHAAATSSALR